jgi:hypothetical protein
MVRAMVVGVELNQILGRAVSCALLGSIASSVAACGGSASSAEDQGVSAAEAPESPGVESVPAEELPALPELPPVEDFRDICLPEGESMFAHMQLTSEFDFIELRNSTRVPPGTTSFAARSTPSLEDPLGTPCAGAADPDACQRRLNTTWGSPESSWVLCEDVEDTCLVSGVVLTLGDEVRLFDSPRELTTLLGAIDTPHEAALLARANLLTFEAPFSLGRNCSQVRTAPTASGFAVIATWLGGTLCPVEAKDTVLHVWNSGALQVVSRDGLSTHPMSGACVGRRPEGLSSAAVPAYDSSSEVGRFFASVAQLEASAVTAFRVIAQELAALGAPRRLQQAVQRAALDEVRHAQLTAALARRYAGQPQPPRIEAQPLRSLFALALDNVIEGCVRETYGAACAAYQAQQARAPEVREQLGGIARDEARHAELSWHIHDWASALLSSTERAELAVAAERAIAALRAELEHDPGSAVRTEAGMPGPEQAHAMLGALQAQLWAPALGLS